MAVSEAPTALVIEDDEGSRLFLKRALERSGMAVVEAQTGSEGMRALQAERPDLVLLDLALPGLDGGTTLDRIRQISEVPVMMVTGQSSEFEKVRALKAGADDYVTKPFGLQELLARAEALLRRARPREDFPGHYADGFVEIDFGAAEARADGKPLHLTPLEFRLLGVFVRHANQVLPAERLLELAWGDGGSARERVKLYVGYLRNKFKKQGIEPPIETIRGFGYRYVTPEQ